MSMSKVCEVGVVVHDLLSGCDIGKEERLCILGLSWFW